MARLLKLSAVSLALVGIGWIASDLYHRRGSLPASRRVGLGGYRFVSPLLDVEMPGGWAVNQEPIPFRHQVERFVEEQIESRTVRDMAVYYRDLIDGPWFGVHEDRTFNPASMMKVPVMIAWLKRAERDPRVLLEAMVFDEREFPPPPQEYPTERSLAAGGRYTVEQLLQFMIAFSDNKAMWLLFRGLDPAELDDVLDSMDAANVPEQANNQVSAHGYSGFFRILFNAAYLGKDMSERALGLLALQRFPRGFAAGVPPGTIVATKFGEWSTGPGRIQLHEFGIVYHPAGPYILGVMTDGSDRDAQAGVLARVSALFYRAHREHEPRAARAERR